MRKNKGKGKAKEQTATQGTKAQKKAAKRVAQLEKQLKEKQKTTQKLRQQIKEARNKAGLKVNANASTGASRKRSEAAQLRREARRELFLARQRDGPSAAARQAPRAPRLLKEAPPGLRYPVPQIAMARIAFFVAESGEIADLGHLLLTSKAWYFWLIRRKKNSAIWTTLSKRAAFAEFTNRIGVYIHQRKEQELANALAAVPLASERLRIQQLIESFESLEWMTCSSRLYNNMVRYSRVPITADNLREIIRLDQLRTIVEETVRRQIDVIDEVDAPTLQSQVTEGLTWLHGPTGEARSELMSWRDALALRLTTVAAFVGTLRNASHPWSRAPYSCDKCGKEPSLLCAEKRCGKCCSQLACPRHSIDGAHYGRPGYGPPLQARTHAERRDRVDHDMPVDLPPRPLHFVPPPLPRPLPSQYMPQPMPAQYHRPMQMPVQQQMPVPQQDLPRFYPAPMPHYQQPIAYGMPPPQFNAYPPVPVPFQPRMSAWGEPPPEYIPSPPGSPPSMTYNDTFDDDVDSDDDDASWNEMASDVDDFEQQGGEEEWVW